MGRIRIPSTKEEREIKRGPNKGKMGLFKVFANGKAVLIYVIENESEVSPVEPAPVLPVADDYAWALEALNEIPKSKTCFYSAAGRLYLKLDIGPISRFIPKSWFTKDRIAKIVSEYQ